jgi:dienelactone hydrolase
VNDQRPQQYNADCAKQAWGRALAFFNAKLSS